MMKEMEVTAKFLPVSLEGRGIALPLTTYSVSYARVRQGKKGLEVIIPGFTEQLLAHIVPLDQFGEIVTLSIFDRVFCERLKEIVSDQEKEKISPSLMRKIAIEIGETGLSGVEAMRRSRARHLLYENLESAILNHLTNQLIKDNVSSDKNFNMADLAHEQEAIELLEGYGLSLGLNGGLVVERLKKIAQIMSGYKGPHKGMNGPVYDIFERLENLVTDLRQWLISEPVEEAEVAQRVALNAEAFLKYSTPYKDSLDEVYDNLDRTIARWDDFEGKLPTYLKKLDLMLDGWQRILDAREKSNKAQRFVQREVLTGFAPFMPVLSKDIIAVEEIEKWLELRRSQLRWVKRISLQRDLRPDGEAILRSAKVGVL